MYTYNLGQKFQSIVLETGEKVAIEFCDGCTVTYFQLEDLSNRIANYLLSINVQKLDVIAIQNSKTIFGFASMIAALKIGAIYTNFDYSNPKERIKKIFELAQPRIVLTDTVINESVLDLCNEMNICYLDYSLNDNQKLIYNKSEILCKDVINNVIGSNPAYIMFTSGSTGIPKGVLIKQESILNFIQWGKATYNLCDNDVMADVNPIYFDNSVFDFYCSVFNKVKMVAIPKDVIANPKEMLDMIDRTKCTIWFSVPSMLIYLMNIKLLNKNNMNSIRIFAFGGEGYPKEHLLKLYNIYSEQSQFYNVYGPTEGTCICSAYKIEKKDFDELSGFITLGNIAPNFEYIIIDENDRETDEGELCILGTQLALGYYNDPERTAKSFVNNPLNHKYEQKMYRTGDLVKKMNNKLYFVGRADNQIKHMGYRIELEEIEAGLIKLPYMKECAVVHVKSKAGFSKLVAYIVTEGDKEDKEVRKDLKTFLPDYMIPNTFKIVDILPKNINGKIDRVEIKRCAELY